MKPRRSRFLQRILAGVVVCGHTALAAGIDGSDSSESGQALPSPSLDSLMAASSINVEQSLGLVPTEPDSTPVEKSILGTEPEKLTSSRMNSGASSGRLSMNSSNGWTMSTNMRNDESLARSLSGAGVTALGAAWRDQMERQLQSIRNRTTTLNGAMPCEMESDGKGDVCQPPPYTVWGNAEIGYNHLDDQGYQPGYKLNTLGGTVGFATSSSEDFTMGAAFTGMSGRIRATGVGNAASGDLDAYYASVFARKESGCVTHTFIGTVGFADTMLKRNASLGDVTYSTKGKSDGVGYGLMYEMGRTFRMNPEYMSNAWWQPVLNISYIHSTIDGYSEDGSDIALNVGKQTRNNVIFGLGGRMQAMVAHEWLNRSALWEMRLLGKATAGARRQKVGVSMAALDESTTVGSAKSGVVGVEMGIGMTMPLGLNCGAVFMDFSAEFADNYNAVNGTVGYRMDF